MVISMAVAFFVAEMNIAIELPDVNVMGVLVKLLFFGNILLVYSISIMVMTVKLIFWYQGIQSQ